MRTTTTISLLLLDGSGASCGGGSAQTGMHRHFIDPLLSLAGWSLLPQRDANSLGNYATLGVKVQADLW